MYYEDSFFTKRLLPQIEVPTQEPYNPDTLAEPSDEDSGSDEEELETEEA